MSLAEYSLIIYKVKQKREVRSRDRFRTCYHYYFFVGWMGKSALIYLNIERTNNGMDSASHCQGAIEGLMGFDEFNHRRNGLGKSVTYENTTWSAAVKLTATLQQASWQRDRIWKLR